MELTDVMGAQRWRHNGHLIAEGVAPFYLDRSMLTLDTTHGHGVFWRDWQPDRIVAMFHPSSDAKSSGDLMGDFTALPFPDDVFDLTVIDAPYMPKGTPSAGGFGEMDAHYGVGSKGQAEILGLMTHGLNESVRVTRPGGLVLGKSGRGIDGGKLWRGDDLSVQHAETQLGLTVVMQWRHLTVPRSQKHRGPQKSPRSNYSTLTLFRTPHTEPGSQPELWEASA